MYIFHLEKTIKQKPSNEVNNLNFDFSFVFLLEECTSGFSKVLIIYC